MRWSHLKSLFYGIVGDDETTPSFFASATIMEFANSALREMVRRTKCLESRYVVAVTSGTAEYNLPTDCEQPWRLTFDDKVLSPITQMEMNVINERWRDKTSSQPIYYYMDELNSQFGLYEKPSVSSTYTTRSGPAYGLLVDTSTVDSRSGATVGIVYDISDATPATDNPEGGIYDILSGYGVEVFYNARPDEIDGSAAQVVQIPAWAMHGILFGMLAEAFESDTELMNLDTSSFYRNLFYHWIGRLRVRSYDKLPMVWVYEGEGERPHAPFIGVQPETIPDPS